MNRNYFLLVNYLTKERLLCSWFENEPDFFGRKVHYIGVTNGLGGYKAMLERGFVDRRFTREMLPFNKIKKPVLP